MYWGFKAIQFTLYTYVLIKILRNDPNFIQKLTPDFKNHVKNLGNFRQAMKSTKSWNLMGYFCPENTFFQLKYIHRISTNCVKIHQITHVIFETISHFSWHNSSIFLAQTLHTFYKSSPSKGKFSDFPLLVWKFTKFLMSNIKSVFLQSLDHFSVSWETILLYFFSWNFIYH